MTVIVIDSFNSKKKRFATFLIFKKVFLIKFNWININN